MQCVTSKHCVFHLFIIYVSRNIGFYTSLFPYLLSHLPYILLPLSSYLLPFLVLFSLQPDLSLNLLLFLGLDTAFNIVSGWQKEFPEEKSFVIPDCLAAKVKRGEMGRKSGKGFYNWEGDKILGPV